MRLFFLVLLTLVDLIGSAGDYYYRISLVEEVAELSTNNVSNDGCIANSVFGQLKTYADIVFYTFSLVCCIFFTFIVAKFKIKVPDSTIKTYRLYYTVVIVAFWAHCIQSLAGTLVLDQFNINWTQTTELVYIAIYDVTMLTLLFFLIRLKKLKINPGQCNIEKPRSFDYTNNGYVGVHCKTSLLTGYVDVLSRKVPTNTNSYIPVDQFDHSLYLPSG